MSKVKTLHPGLTTSERKVVNAATAATADPISSDIGHNLQGADFLHVYAAFASGATAATVTPWYYSTISGLWYEGDAIPFTTASQFALVEIRGEERVFIVVDSVAGGGSVSIWLGWSSDGA